MASDRAILSRQARGAFELNGKPEPRLDSTLRGLDTVSLRVVQA
jgi:hypothetical protein